VRPLDEDELRNCITPRDVNRSAARRFSQNQIDGVRIPVCFDQPAHHLERRLPVDRREKKGFHSLARAADIRQVQLEHVELILPIEKN
jgi:hypothetical protein